MSHPSMGQQSQLAGYFMPPFGPGMNHPGHGAASWGYPQLPPQQLPLQLPPSWAYRHPGRLHEAHGSSITMPPPAGIMPKMEPDADFAPEASQLLQLGVPLNPAAVVAQPRSMFSVDMLLQEAAEKAATEKKAQLASVETKRLSDELAREKEERLTEQKELAQLRAEKAAAAKAAVDKQGPPAD